MSTCSASMNDTLRDAFMVEPVDFLPRYLVLQQRWTRGGTIGGFQPETIQNIAEFGE